eukprot:10515-Pyramimonas_sp.AAC.1
MVEKRLHPSPARECQVIPSPPGTEFALGRWLDASLTRPSVSQRPWSMVLWAVRIFRSGPAQGLR